MRLIFSCPGCNGDLGDNYWDFYCPRCERFVSWYEFADLLDDTDERRDFLTMEEVHDGR